MKVGLFFGSFNPVHVGHLILAQTALNQTELDKVWFIISPQNPFKEKKNLLAEYDRLRMAELAIGDHLDIQASNVEFSLPQPSYTIDTLTHLRDRYSNYEFSLIMGQDNLQYLDRWKNYEAITKYYQIYVYPRIEAGPSPFDEHPNVHFFEAPLLNISASYLRKLVKEGKAITYMVDKEVENYIEKNALFR
ncbi:MAG: nicotinate-nucleotide adenylyltransferase [Bacteroidia bacterium]|nr:nicotinate-nucleotide adenylyltransferase [Bacteroidia bacterium]